MLAINDTTLLSDENENENENENNKIIMHSDEKQQRRKGSYLIE